ncbi:Sec-independent protein translocase subunit TatC [Methylocaldum marinum]|uniref:Sec-independent protein translocase protein TatC n=1 Tax=Methylocaldum marinum TaxID=1432792 RepID=A0A250KX65_9GAMM|nr:twin-arginine translocase subunit TatC [Methylocaldum marinum]BBA35551.1 Sec-independent protein translocase subunit TatC [Methylocaldum marinum]
MSENLDLSKAPLLTHLIELRRRLLYCLLFFAIAFAVSYEFSNQIYSFLLEPLERAFGVVENRRMIYTGLHEAFFTYLKLSFFSASFFSIPLVLIQVWRFLAPGLYSHERKSLFPLILMTPIQFLAGAAVAYYVVMPLAWSFFLSFESLSGESALAVELEARISEYLSISIQLIIAFGLCFELPVLLMVMAKVGMISSSSLIEHRRHAIIGIFLVAAFITPPDLISQIALGTPIVLLYELSILLIKITRADALFEERKQAMQ